MKFDFGMFGAVGLGELVIDYDLCYIAAVAVAVAVICYLLSLLSQIICTINLKSSIVRLVSFRVDRRLKLFYWETR